MLAINKPSAAFELLDALLVADAIGTDEEEGEDEAITDSLLFACDDEEDEAVDSDADV
jgi:hypothetical protein